MIIALRPRYLLACLASWLFTLSALGQLRAEPAYSETTSESETKARADFEQGRDAYERGDFKEALSRFERAYTLSPRPELLYNVGRAADSDGQWQRAISAYSSYLQALPESANKAFVRARLEKVQELHRMNGSGEVKVAPGPPPLPPVTTALPAEPTSAARNASAPLRQTRDEMPQKRLWWKRGWLWTAIGVAVAGGVTASIVAPRNRDPARAAADDHVSLTLRMP